MAPTQQAVQETQSTIGTAAVGQAPTLFGGQAGLMSGQQALGTQVGEAQQILQAGQMGLGEGQQALGAGQQALGAGQQALGTGQQALGAGQQALGTQVGGVQTGVTGLQQAVGQAADGDQKATGLYAGQSGLMASQQQLGQDIGRQIGGVKAGVSDFQRAVEAYQRGAQAQRADIQSAALTGRDKLQRQIGDVGIQANRAAEQLVQARQAAATPVGASRLAVGAIPGGVQQQAAQFARTAPAPSQTAPTGPLGPVSADPRDALIQQLISGYRGLLSPQQ
jgi:prophage DNA circulation protein